MANVLHYLADGGPHQSQNSTFGLLVIASCWDQHSSSKGAAAQEYPASRCMRCWQPDTAAPIAQVHAKDKPIPREGNAVWESDALLHRTAELTIGMAGADLANLLNEASILMACPPHTLTLPSSLLRLHETL